MFRASERNEIANLINKTATFDFSDFTIVEDKNHVQIKYLYSEKNFFFSFNIPEKETSTKNNYGEETFIFKFFGNMNPGRISTLESYTANSIYELHDKIKLWIKELEVELLNIQVHRKFVKTKKACLLKQRSFILKLCARWDSNSHAGTGTTPSK